MLVLSRKVGERIEIGDDVLVAVVSIRDKSVRLGIEAPRKLNIVRAEIGATRKTQADESDVAVLPEHSTTCLACGATENPILVPRWLLTPSAALRAERRQRLAQGEDWFLDSANIADLLRDLVASGNFGPSDFEDMLAIVERPWRWSGEYWAMRDRQRRLERQHHRE